MNRHVREVVAHIREEAQRHRELASPSDAAEIRRRRAAIAEELGRIANRIEHGWGEKNGAPELAACPRCGTTRRT